MPDENKAQDNKAEGNSLETLVSEIKTQVSGALEKVNGVPDEDAIRSMVQEELQTQAAKNSPKDGTNAGAPAIAQFAEAKKFDNLSFKELAVGHQLLSQAKGLPKRKADSKGEVEGPSADMTFALAARAIHDTQTKDEQGEPTRRQMSRQRIPMNASDMKGWAVEYAVRHKSFPREAMKANELEHTGNEGFGAEWVGVAYSSSLWEEIMIASPILPMMPRINIPQGFNSVVIPIEGRPPHYYVMAEGTAQGNNPGYTDLTARTSRLGTANVTATPHKIGAATTWSGEITEDQVVMFAPILMASLAEEGGHVFDSMIINGDTTSGTGNINTQGHGSGPGATPTRPEFLVNGFRKISLQTSGRSADARVAPDGAQVAADTDDPKVLNNVLQAIQLFGQAGAEGMDTTKVGIISNIGFDFVIRGDSDFRNTERRFYSVQDDKVVSIFGYNYTCSVDFARIRGVGTDLNTSRKMNAAGLVSTTAGNNTKDAFVMVRWDQWYWVQKRMMQTHVEYVPRADAYELTNMCRVGLVSRPGLESRAVQVYNI